MKLPFYLRPKPAMGLIVGLGGLVTLAQVTVVQTCQAYGYQQLAPLPIVGSPWALGTPPLQVWGLDASWSSLSSSADGGKLVGVITSTWWTGWLLGPGGSLPPPLIGLSTDAGASWVGSGAPSNNWVCVASSADGARLVAAATLALEFDTAGSVTLNGDGLIYTSTNSGATWVSSSPVDVWSSIASSADGNTLFAAATVEPPSGGTGPFLSGDGLIYASTNAGATWSASSAPSENWSSIACSADGRKLVAASQASWNGTNFTGGRIYCSADAGATWMVTGAPRTGWASVACSADGAKLVAAGGEQVYISRDFGATWIATTAPTNDWTAVCSSADGTKLAAAWGFAYPDFVGETVAYGQVFLSADAGATWELTGAPTAAWSALASSADGYRVVAGSSDDYLCRLPYLGPWRWAGATNYDLGLIASSADGSNLVAAGALIYTSHDSGSTWAAASVASGEWVSVASSADGTKLAAATLDSGLYISTDSGASWSADATGHWASVAWSADGTRLVAATEARSSWGGFSGQIYVSPDSGATWIVSSAPGDHWSSLALSANGTKMVAAAVGANPWDGVAGSGRIHLSSDSGASWTLSGAPSNNWICVAASADASRLVAAASSDRGGDGLIYTSYDSGASWLPVPAPPHNWSSVACSSEGATMVAVAEGDAYVSTNAGAAWVRFEPPAGADWDSVACSADGHQIIAVGDPTGVLRWPLPSAPVPPSPQLYLGSLRGESLDLSWLVPSSRFVLQQNPNPDAANWLDVTNQPVLNCADLHNQVRLPQSSRNRFYRLKQQ